MVRSWAFTACCGLATVLVLLPLPWHWKARNTGTLLYITWTVIGNVNFMANSIIWAGNLRDPAPVWCDISSKIIIGQSVGLTAASLCINRRLYAIATIQSVSIDRALRRRRIIVDLILGVGLPCLIMALHYIVQGHRYDIHEDLGCWPNTYPTLLAVALLLVPPMIIAVASFIYAGLSIHAFLRTRRQFNQVLNNSHSGINMSRYFRMMGLSSTEMLFALPFSIYITVLDLSGPVAPWISFQDTHYKFSTVFKFPTVLLKTAPEEYRVLMINQWLLPAGGFLFFVWFGLAGEALAEYRRFFYMLVAPFGIKPKIKGPQPAAAWTDQLASSDSARGRDGVLYPSLPEIKDSDITEEKISGDVEASGSKA